MSTDTRPSVTGDREGPNLDTVLDDLHDASGDPSARETARMMLRFPEFEGEIVEHAAAWLTMRAWELVNETRRAFGDAPHSLMLNDAGDDHGS